MSETHDRPGSINQRPGIPVLPNGTSRSRLKAGLLAGAAAVALIAATVHSIRAESPQLRGATAMRWPRKPANGQMSGFADLVATVKPAVVSVRVKADIAPQLMANDTKAGRFKARPSTSSSRSSAARECRGSRGQPRVRARAGLASSSARTATSSRTIMSSTRR